MQGKGWEIYESDRTQQENLDIFKCVKTLFDLENPNPKPNIEELKTIIKKEI